MATQITLKESADLIAAVGHEVTVLMEGEPGIGKSQLLLSLAKTFPEHDAVYFDCTTKDLGDFFYPDVREEYGHKVLHFIPNAQFRAHTGRPAIIMLDELGKCANRAVLNAALPIIHERRLGEVQLHPRTIICATTNLSTDGVGDTIPAHARNRMTVVRVSKPTADEWLQWGGSSGVVPEIMAFAKQFPHCLASYTDPSQKDNPYIYQPTKQQVSYVSPRSLFKSSLILAKRAALTTNALVASLAGTGGEAFARDMVAFLQVADKLPSIEQVENDPMNATVPNDAAAVMVLVFGMLAKMTAERINAFMVYIKRLPKEAQAVFFESALHSEKANIAVKNNNFKKWAIDNNYLY